MRNDLDDQFARWKSQRGITTDPTAEYAARFLLEQSLRLSYILFAITAVLCIVTIAAIPRLTLPPLAIWLLVAMSGMLTWINRRGVTQIPRLVDIMHSWTSRETHGIARTIMVVDLLSLGMSSVTLADLVVGMMPVG